MILQILVVGIFVGVVADLWARLLGEDLWDGEWW